MQHPRFTLLLGAVAAALLLPACNDSAPETRPVTGSPAPESASPGLPDEANVPATAGTATFAAGCFWCVEEVFHQAPGVLSAVSGYMGGSPSDANYKQVSAGLTDHAEVVQVRFDPAVTSFEQLVDLFWKLHDPTQVDRQGPDYGRQYRSAIFFHDAAQETAALASRDTLQAAKVHGNKPIATEITAATIFHPAEEYHQDFARINPGHPYLRAHLYPKLRKLGMTIPE